MEPGERIERRRREAAHGEAENKGRRTARIKPASRPPSGIGKNRVEPRPRLPDVPLMAHTTSHYRVFETAAGFCGIAWNDVGITRFQLPTRGAAATERLLQRRVPGAAPGAPPPAVAAAIAAAIRYFAGETVDFSDIALDLGAQEPLFERIYQALRRVGWGHTTTYGTLAKELGQGPEVARDVGAAMASNPVPLIIPCHRVLAAGGKLGGFSAPGGAATKRRMLELEGVSLDPPPPAQQAFGF
jgi:methylated-DNA-[protein]-cysteine S-methyltransferase